MASVTQFTPSNTRVGLALLGIQVPPAASPTPDRTPGFSSVSDFVSGPPAVTAPGIGQTLSAATPVSPTQFQQGQIYLQQETPTGYTYTNVSASQVPRGSIVYVNGMSTDGPGAANYAQCISKNNSNRDVYVVYNNTPETSVLQLGLANWNPTSDDYSPIETVKSILQATGGDATLMAHSMGEAINDDAAMQYAQSGGSLKNTYVYSWGGAGNAENADAIAKLGAHATNFVHQQIIQTNASGSAVTIQAGDQWAGARSYVVAGDNWATENENAAGQETSETSNDSHTVGINYTDGLSPNSDSGHDYLGQAGDTLGGFVTPEL